MCGNQKYPVTQEAVRLNSNQLTLEAAQVGVEVTDGYYRGPIQKVETITYVTFLHRRGGYVQTRKLSDLQAVPQYTESEAWTRAALKVLEMLNMPASWREDDKEIRHQVYIILGKHHDKNHSVTKAQVQTLIDETRKLIDGR